MQPTIIKNFISKDTAYYLNNYFRPLVEINPNGLLNVPLTAGDNGLGFSCKDPAIKESNISLDIVTLIVEAIAHRFNLPKNRVSIRSCNYQVLVEGQEIGYHSDNRGAYRNKMKNDGWSALLYLDDQYTGGEILFYELDENGKEISKSYHPTPGTLIYFKGDEEHCHSVNKVINGERPNLILFFDVND
jgi:hypothetical protein